MSSGTNRISVRMSSTFRMAVEDYCEKRKTLSGGIEEWTFTDFVLRAIADKLNHIERSKRSNHKWVIEAVEGGAARLICTYRDRKPHPDAASIETEEWTEADVEKVRNMSDEEWMKRNLDKMIEE